MKRRWLLALALLMSGSQAAGLCDATPERFSACIKPSQTDAKISKYDDAHWISYDRAQAPARLLVFMPGTGGKPPGPARFLDTAVGMGYRVISLAYNDDPAIAVYCPRLDPACSAQFRQMRVFGDSMMADEAIRNSPAEAIVPRLVSLLRHLHASYPQDHWNDFLIGGEPDWSRITLTGQSQGAGMAAYIAKQKLVARVILFSSPWDFHVQGPGKRSIAPWLANESKTPPERWYGGYHAKENTADLLGEAYRTLAVPKDHIRVFDGPLPAGIGTKSNNPYHGQGIGNPAYAPDWQRFLAN